VPCIAEHSGRKLCELSQLLIVFLLSSSDKLQREHSCIRIPLLAELWMLNMYRTLATAMEETQCWQDLTASGIARFLADLGCASPPPLSIQM